MADAVHERLLGELAAAFAPEATLYAVGGYVRDKLLGIECYDIDVCSKLTVEQVKTLLSTTDFEVYDRNMRLGTVHIMKQGVTFEYTAFRTDSYRRAKGSHSPVEVEFTDDMLKDAKRRDFSCNAVYMDVAAGKIVDIVGGVKGIEDKVLRTADIPENVFEADGLRILRLVRFAAELGFEPEARTLEVAKQNSWRVKDIAVERIRDELDKIFVADTRHPELGLKDAHLKGFRLLDELGLVDMLLPELAGLKGLSQPPRWHKFDAYEHSVKTYQSAPPNIRWAALLHDIGKAPAVKADGNMHAHDVYGAKMADDVARRLKFSTAERTRLVSLVQCHMADVGGRMSEAKLRRFIVRHADIVDDLCELMDADSHAAMELPPERNRMREQLMDMRAAGVPLRLSELKVNGADLIDMNIEERLRGELLWQLLEETAMNPVLNDREKALNFVAALARRASEEQ